MIELTPTDALIDWLAIQIECDHRIARDAADLQEDPENGWGAVGGNFVTPHIGYIYEDQALQHIVRFNPARALHEVEFKRALLVEHGVVHPGTDYQYCRVCHDYTTHDAVAAPCRSVRAMALAYADRPGYRDEWRLT